MTIAIIAEDFAGMRSQATGLVERAGYDWTFHPVRRVGFWSRFPIRHARHPLRGMAPFDIPDGTTAMVSVGGTGGVAGEALARQFGLPAIQIQNPRMAADRFDLIVANVHDGINGPNIVLARNAMHNVTPDKLDAARRLWLPKLKKGSQPLISALVGGANGRFRFGVREAAALGNGLTRMAREADASVVLTPSRRTAPEAISVLQEALAPVAGVVWNGEGDNPYQGLLACADLIVVTGDSVSMVSEAVATAAPVMVVDLPGRSRRISAFIDTLQEAGRVRRFAGRWEEWDVSPLDDTPMAAGELRRRLGDRLR